MKDGVITLCFFMRQQSGTWTMFDQTLLLLQTD